MGVGGLIVYFAFLALFCNCEPETMCTKFTYQEQLLEKLVRMEFRIERMEKEIKKMEIETNDRIKALGEHEVNIDADMIKLRKHLIGQEPIVAFTARLVANKTPDKYKAIAFKKVMLNEGDAYDNTTGFFTAPVDGIYHLTSHLCVHSNLSLHYVIMVEYKPWASGYYKSKDKGTCASVSVTAKIREGQRAWVTQDGYYLPPKLLYEDNNDRNHFSGFLVKQL